MIRKVLLYSILTLVILISVYHTHLELIKFTVNSLLVNSNVELTEIGQIQWHDRAIAVDHIVLTVLDTDKKQTLSGVLWGFSEFSLKKSQLTIQKISVSLPTEGARTKNSHGLSLGSLLNQINQFPLGSLIINELVLPQFKDPISIQWLHNVHSQSLSIRDQFTAFTVLLDQKHAEQLQGEMEITHKKDNHLNTVAKVDLTILLEEKNHQLNIIGNIYLSFIPGLLRHYIDYPEQLANLDGKLSFEGSGSFNEDFSQAEQIISLSKDSILTATVKTTEHDHTVLELLLPEKISLLAGSTLTVATETLKFAIENERFLADSNGQLRSTQCSWQALKPHFHCTGEVVANLKSELFEYEDWQFKKNQIRFSSQFDINESQIVLSINPDTLLRSSQLNFGAKGKGSAQNIQITTEGDFTTHIKLPLTLDKLSLKKLHVLLPQLQLEDMTMATKLMLSDINFSNNGERKARANVSTESLNIRIAERWLPALSFKSTIDLNQFNVISTGDLQSDQQFELLGFNLQHNMNTRTGKVSLTSNSLNINTDNVLSKHFSSWPFNWDIQQGQYTASAELFWKNGLVSGDIKQQFTDISGIYLNSAFIGLNTNIDTIVHSLDHITNNQPIEIRVKSVDIGLPITDIQLRMRFDSLKQWVNIEHMQASLLDGVVELNNMSYIFGKQSTMEVNIKDLSVNKALSLSGYDSVWGTGRISGNLPVTLSNDGTLIIEGGFLSAKEPGGVIKYQPTTVTSNASLQLVADALSNYQYDVLKTKVLYKPNGDLNLSVNMQGKNPDLYDGKRINLNVNLTDNIPMLLRSLQAGRTVTELVERKLEAPQ